MTGVGVVSRSKLELVDCRFGCCVDGGGVIEEDGGGGEVYFDRSMFLKTGAGRQSISNETGGELGLATFIDVVGEAEAGGGRSESAGRVAWWGCGVDGTWTCAVSSNCADGSMTMESNQSEAVWAMQMYCMKSSRLNPETMRRHSELAASMRQGQRGVADIRYEVVAGRR